MHFSILTPLLYIVINTCLALSPYHHASVYETLFLCYVPLYFYYNIILFYM